MPRRTAKINHPDLESIEEAPEANQEAAKAEHADQDDSEDGVSMLGLDDLRDLIFLGKLRETVDISGYKFVVTTLTAAQQKEIMVRVMQFDQVERILDIKPISIAYVLETVNGVPLEELCEDDSLESDVDRRFSVVMSMQSVVVEKLYQTYEKLVKLSNEEVGLEDLKE